MSSIEVARRVEKWLTRLSGSLAYYVRYIFYTFILPRYLFLVPLILVPIKQAVPI